MIAYTTTYENNTANNIDIKKISAQIAKKDILVKNLIFAGILACFVAAIFL